ncbi:MAG: AAA domain-containing protein [Proteobacteria bacterium]|nr:AAA domain-containing protein [Pseudomonadota bacterium]
MTDTIGKVLAIRDDLNNTLIERETAVDAAVLALLTQQHLLLLGPPGTAKSLLVRSFCERIAGANYFERLLTKFSTPEELFGPLSLSALEQDRYERVTDGTLVEAHIGFVDEIFKANSAILNTMLTVMNERIFHQGSSTVAAPLQCLFAASNETPEDGSLAALHDRFVLRVEVPYLTDDDSMRLLINRKEYTPGMEITLDELYEAQREVRNIPITDSAIDAIINIKHELEQEGIAVSDRRWKQCADLLKARAYLDGDTEANDEHGVVLIHALWDEPKDQRTVERCVSKVCNPLNLEAVELEDAAKDLYDQKPEPEDEHLTSRLEPLLKQIKDIHARLETRIGGVPDSRSMRAKQALKKVEGWHRDLSTIALRSLSKLHQAPGAA